MAEFTPIDDQALATARARGKDFYAGVKAVSVKLDVDRQRIVVGLDTSLEFSFDPKQVPQLDGKSFDDLADVLIDGVGSVIYFPRLDIDLFVAPLIEALAGKNHARRAS